MWFLLAMDSRINENEHPGFTLTDASGVNQPEYPSAHEKSKKSAGEVLAAKQAPHRPGTSPA
jgi:hypothetical protein